jgi:hypothetical protein
MPDQLCQAHALVCAVCLRVGCVCVVGRTICAIIRDGVVAHETQEAAPVRTQV